MIYTLMNKNTPVLDLEIHEETASILKTAEIHNKSICLSDQYWINAKSNPLDWHHVNFFENMFMELVKEWNSFKVW